MTRRTILAVGAAVAVWAVGPWIAELWSRRQERRGIGGDVQGSTAGWYG